MSNALNPALIIGLGGSGVEIARRFRRRLVRDYPDSPHVRVIGIDTDPQQIDREDSPRLPDSSFYHAGNFNMAQYVSERSIGNFPQIRAWWRGYHSLPASYIAVGAGQRRPIGRLALFVHFNGVKALLERELRAIFSASTFAQLSSDQRQRLTVYIVGSTCGGTGTGMFLDIAYVARQLVPEIVTQATPQVRGVLLMPSLFIGTQQVPQANREALYANAYGALTELDFFMSRHTQRSVVEYPTTSGSWSVSRAEKPFDSCFLLGNQDAQGAVFASWGDLVERASAHLHIDLASSLGPSGMSQLANVEQDMWAMAQVKAKWRVYSALNADSIELPSARIRARWTRTFALEECERLDSAANDRGRLDQALTRLAEATGWARLGSLALGEGLRNHLPRVEQLRAAVTAVNPDQPDSKLIAQAAHQLQAQADRRIAQTTLSAEVSDALRLIPDEIDERLRVILAEGSFADALGALDEIRRRVDTMQASVAERARKAAPDWLGVLLGEIGKAKGVFESKDSYARRLQDASLRAVGEAELVWEKMLAATLARALDDYSGIPALREHIDARRERVEALQAWLGSVAPRITRMPLPELAPGTGAALTDQDIDEAYETGERRSRLRHFVRDHVNTLFADTVSSAEELTRALHSMALQAVSSVADDFIASTDIRQEQIAERLARLQPLAVFSPEWNALTLGGGVSPPRRILLVGLPSHMVGKVEAIRRSLPIEARDAQFEQIGNEDRVLMFTQHHGFPLFALAEIEQCRRAFSNDHAGHVLRFTMPDDEVRRWSIEPTGVMAAQQWFAIALALGRIERVGANYVYKERTAGLGDVEHLFETSGVGRSDARQRARDAFNERGFASAFEQTWPSEVRRLGGNDAVYELLQAWIRLEQERATGADFPTEFREDLDAVRRYAEQIR